MLLLNFLMAVMNSSDGQRLADGIRHYDPSKHRRNYYVTVYRAGHVLGPAHKKFWYETPMQMAYLVPLHRRNLPL